jgi:hypothetical protein
MTRSRAVRVRCPGSSTRSTVSTECAPLRDPERVASWLSTAANVLVATHPARLRPALCKPGVVRTKR